MRRDSSPATTLLAALADRGVNVSGRRLECWSGEALFDPSEMTLEEQVDHCLALAELSGSGHGADAVAIGLAARGFASPRLRDTSCRLVARLSGLEADAMFPTGTAVPDRPPTPSGDQGFLLLESIASEAVASLASLAHPFRAVLEAMQRNAATVAPELGEDGEAVFHSALVNGLYSLLGGCVYNPAAIAAVFNVGPTDGGPGAAADLVDSMPDASIADFTAALWNEPVADLALAACCARRMLPEFLAYLGAEELDLDDLDELAVAWAPVVIAMARTAHRQDLEAGFGAPGASSVPVELHALLDGVPVQAASR